MAKYFEQVDGEHAVLLTTDEVQCLVDILYKVGGDPVASPRRHSETVLAALRQSGRAPNRAVAEGNIMFRSRS